MLNGILLAGASEQLALGNLVFVLLSFVVLLFFIGKFAWKPVVKIMQDRADKIANDLDSAEQAKSEAEQLAEKRTAELQATQAQATTIINNAKETADQRGEDIIAEAKQNADSLKVKANAEIDQERVEAMASVKNDVAELSVSIAQKIIQKELKLDDQKALIDAYIGELEAK
ncbi:F0F1 ATP synthase subunit B [Weissella diestrammenae]|uniref:ATP synthase subunit b n=1 Tax=Weissella diestrammenae TaxID=1162633 RepID=A0A7G9T6V4_9LACO|nr:F0F1 ATP synthase subunit B [Weissella diestrammenae]MCM0582579.1 F0F1 ATP synthase subunit B [Weissella diestrammenae]QNN75829.1 F0F1 ATP synthase subunit B [Weissella diestrammenae]